MIKYNIFLNLIYSYNSISWFEVSHHLFNLQVDLDVFPLPQHAILKFTPTQITPEISAPQGVETLAQLELTLARHVNRFEQVGGFWVNGSGKSWNGQIVGFVKAIYKPLRGTTPWLLSSWWFQIYCSFRPDLWWDDPFWRAYVFQMGWFNRQLDVNCC